MNLSRFIPLVLALLGIALWYIGYSCLSSLHCSFNNTFDEITPSVLAPIGIYCICAILPAFLALFVSVSTYKTWIRSAVAWAVAAIVLISLTPTSSGGFFQTILWSRGATAFTIGAFFAIASLLFFALKLLPRKKKN